MTTADTATDETGLSPLGASLRTALDGRWARVRQSARERLHPEDFSAPPGLDLHAHRAGQHRQPRRIRQTRQTRQTRD